MILMILQTETTEPVKEIIVSSTELQGNLWFWIALLEVIIIGFLIFRLNKKKRELSLSEFDKRKFKKSQSAKIDMDNLMKSINGSRDLYKQLSKVCHPDRFINEECYGVSLEIFKEISKNKRDFSKLSSLKERAIKELNVNFKNK